MGGKIEPGKNAGRGALAALALLATLPTVAAADSVAPPRSYRAVAPGGAYEFVMLVPASGAGSAGAQPAAGASPPMPYPASGMYRSGDRTPLWTVSWYAAEVHPASDGKHLVRIGPWATGFEDEALSFFAEGRLLRRYEIRELVPDPRAVSWSVSHFVWKQSSTIDSAAGTFSLVTVDGTRYVFGLADGAVLSSERPVPARSDAASPPSTSLATDVAIALGAAAAAFALWRSRRR